MASALNRTISGKKPPMPGRKASVPSMPVFAERRADDANSETLAGQMRAVNYSMDSNGEETAPGKSASGMLSKLRSSLSRRSGDTSMDEEDKEAKGGAIRLLAKKFDRRSFDFNNLRERRRRSIHQGEKVTELKKHYEGSGQSAIEVSMSDISVASGDHGSTLASIPSVRSQSGYKVDFPAAVSPLSEGEEVPSGPAPVDTTAKKAVVIRMPEAPGGYVLKSRGESDGEGIMNGQAVNWGAEREVMTSSSTATKEVALSAMEEQFWGPKLGSGDSRYNAGYLERAASLKSKCDVSWQMLDFGPEWWENVLIVPHNAIRSEMADLSSMVAKLEADRYGLSLRIVEDLMQWLEYFVTFMRAYFRILKSAVLPWARAIADSKQVEVDAARVEEMRNTVVSKLTEVLLKYDAAPTSRAPGEYVKAVSTVYCEIASQLVELLVHLEAEVGEVARQCGVANSEQTLETRIVDALREGGEDGLDSFLVMIRWLRTSHAPRAKAMERLFNRGPNLRMALAKRTIAAKHDRIAQALTA
mmetsp:Transcript_10275/g.24599  ORF Transcript_10275/g.24599 Transcript_10275/m.24599 type:complete len:529 (-) Transcript_10275:217-1803(-)|eukprot:CAMPEP_0198314400 /NCGR_PEP_ID=MMETSP1450-20131203/5042_1 /TAXON_ID=753684 ORGANISM="Madagascaria erythrocladiodes, Strain CCMP3234" /NCGR_SAMPLE_ID=MMETSP1450 /ASSEMBLY_ACC=CAM_ASM_001115 /LENGTH=528 /DNA_ID=CAMNT_0044017445 /DNA_START=89 /DNA_END=1675 /DNA_ORIENTATION=+